MRGSPLRSRMLAFTLLLRTRAPTLLYVLRRPSCPSWGYVGRGGVPDPYLNKSISHKTSLAGESHLSAQTETSFYTHRRLASLPFGVLACIRVDRMLRLSLVTVSDSRGDFHPS